MPKVIHDIDTYTYFKRINPSLDSGLLLDYGSNYGRFLDKSYGRFDQKLYTGIDVDNDALDEGRKLFPNATFIHYDGYNCAYNPNGQKNLRPTLTQKFSNIISYSVFTHTTEDDMLDSVAWLYDQLEPGGKIMATFCSADNTRAIVFNTINRYSTFRNFEWYDRLNVFYLSGDLINVESPKVGKMTFTLYKLKHIKNILSQYNAEFFDAPFDIQNAFQECFVITKPS